jgi:hypothetical protein
VTAPAPVSVRAHFERFPATVKGAFVIRGEDPDPHQVVFRESRVVSMGGRLVRVLGTAGATLDVAPRRDVFIPFEFTVSDLEPGWYELECDLDVDGVAGTFSGGRRFAVAWPRATVRRGSVRVDREVEVGGGSVVRVEQVECAGDSIKIHLVADPPDPVSVRLAADGSALEVLDVDFDSDTGRGKVTAYPLLRVHRSLDIDLVIRRGSRRVGDGSVEIVLP